MRINFSALTLTLISLSALSTPGVAEVLYVASAGTTTVSQITLGGTVSNFATSTTNSNFGMAMDQSGNLYIANANAGTITKVTPSGTSTTFASGLSAINPHALAVNSGGNIVVGTVNGSRMQVYSNSGASLGTFGDISVATYAMTYDSIGNLFVADISNNAIVKFNSAGTSSTFIASTYSVGGTSLSGPDGIAFDASGNLFVTDGGNNRILKFDSNGNGSVFASGITGGVQGITFDSAGNLYAADNNRSIYKITAGGSVSTFATLSTGAPTYIIDSVPPTAAPEPSTWALCFGGAVALWIGKTRSGKSRKA